MSPEQPRQPSGVPIGGQYATAPRPESCTTLPPAVKTPLERLTATYKDGYSREAAESLAQRLLDENTMKGRDPELVAAYMERFRDTRRYQHDVDLQALVDHGMTIDDVDMLTGLTGTKAAPWQLVHTGVTPARATRLCELGVSRPSAMSALHKMPDDAIAEWVAAMKEDLELNRWVAAVPIIADLHAAGVTISLANKCRENGIEPSVIIRRPHLDPVELAQYAATAKMAPRDAAPRLDAGIDATVAAEYGANISMEDTRNLVATRIPGKVARSLRAKDKYLTVTDIAALHAARITTGAAYKTWTDATDIFDTSNLAALVASGITPGQVDGYRHQGFSDAAMWHRMHAAGVGDISVWAAAGLEHRAVTPGGTLGRPSRTAEGMSVFAAAGGTPQRLAQLTRAGIPIEKAAAFKDSSDPWKDGAPFRKTAMAEEERMHKTWGHLATEPQPWPWTKGTYQAGLKP